MNTNLSKYYLYVAGCSRFSSDKIVVRTETVASGERKPEGDGRYHPQTRVELTPREGLGEIVSLVKNP